MESYRNGGEWTIEEWVCAYVCVCVWMVVMVFTKGAQLKNQWGSPKAALFFSVETQKKRRHRRDEEEERETLNKRTAGWLIRANGETQNENENENEHVMGSREERALREGGGGTFLVLGGGKRGTTG